MTEKCFICIGRGLPTYIWQSREEVQQGTTPKIQLAEDAITSYLGIPLCEKHIQEIYNANLVAFLNIK